MKTTITLISALVLLHNALWAEPKSNLEIKRKEPVSGQTLTVRNGTVVSLKLLNKSPFETCSVDSKREAIVEASPWPSLLGLFSGAAAGITFAPAVTPNITIQSEQLIKSAPAPASRANEIGAQIMANLKASDAEATRLKDVAEQTAKELQQAKEAASAFLDGSYDEATAAAFGSARERASTQVGQAQKLLLPGTLPSATSLQSLYDITLRLVREYQLTPGADPSFSSSLLTALEHTRGKLDALTAAIEKLKSAGAKLDTLHTYFEDLKKPEWTYSKTFNSDQNAKITGSVSCQDTLSKEPTLEPVYFTITFQDPPRLSISAGVLLSGLPEEHVALGQVVTGRTGAVPAIAGEVQKSTARPQVLPMSFIQIRLWDTLRKGRYDTFNLTPGIGLNPKNKEAEFFGGVSWGFGSFYLSGGAHIGHGEQAAGGFQVGDRPAADVTVPVRQGWTTGFSFGFSYRLPLK